MNNPKLTALSSLLLLAVLGTAHAGTSIFQYRVQDQASTSADKNDGLPTAMNFPERFSPQQVNTAGEARRFNLTNQGTRKLVVQGVMLNGDLSSFSMMSACDGKLLRPTQSCEVSLEVHEIGLAGTKEALIRVDHDGQGVNSLALIGQSVLPSIEVPSELSVPGTPVGDAISAWLSTHNEGLGPYRDQVTPTGIPRATGLSR